MDSNTTPQLPPFETKSRSMDSRPPPPQLRPSETKSGSMDGSSTSTSTPPQLPPNSNDLQQQAEPYSWTSTTKVRREDANFNLLQEVMSMQSPPLGLKLTITPEFLAKLTRATAPAPAPAPATRGRVKQPPEKAGKAPTSASKIQATSISIGPNWRKESIREDHLTLKLYFAKKKLIWEFLEGQLKEKIEVSWSDITAIHAHIPDNQPGILQIKLGNTPLFYRETSPIPMKHTLWGETTDFTHGQAASRHRIYETEFAHGVLDAHYTKLLKSDQRLLKLSKNPFPYPYPNPNPTPTQGACLPSTLQQQQQQQQSLSVNNPRPSTAAALQQLPFSFTGVEQSLPYNNLTPSIPASQYLNPMTVASSSYMHGESSSSRNADHHHLAFGDDSEQIGGQHSSFLYDASFLDSSQLLQGMSYNQPLLHQEELNQFQNYNSTHSHFNNVPANTYGNNLYGHVEQPTLDMENTALHHQHNTAATATLPGGETAPEEYWPQLDGNGVGNNNSMDLFDLYKFHTGQRGP